MLAFIDADGNLVQRVPDDADLTHYDLTGMTVLPAESDDVLIPDLAAGRARQRAIINLARDAAQDGVCQTPHGLFQCGPRSRDFLKGSLDAAERLAAKGLLTEVKWTLADDRDVLLTVPQLEEAGLAIAAHVAAMHARARVLKSRIDAAETLAEIAAVTWTLQD
jgi:D-serine deaminase-like pyridoxal phosphate-dependent protein